MSDLQRLFGYGVLLNSTLYLGACFVAGLSIGNGIAWRLAILAMGFAYLSHAAQFASLRGGTPLVVLSIIVGAIAGLALLF